MIVENFLVIGLFFAPSGMENFHHGHETKMSNYRSITQSVGKMAFIQFRSTISVFRYCGD